VDNNRYHSVWVVTPNRVDAELALSFLAERRIQGRACDSLRALCELLPQGAGCVVLAEEALVESELGILHATLAEQPAWSDLPLILIAGEGAALGAMVERAFPYAGNITLLERPLNPLTLVSAAQVGLRARARQLEVRDLLLQREEALNSRDEFLAMLAHELRNPLAPIRNAVYLQQTLDIDDSMFVKTREIVGKQVTHLTRMLDDLLDVARLERGKVRLQMQRMELNSMITAVVDACSQLAQSRDHVVRIKLASEPLTVDADPVRVEQMVTNLLTNASKFTPNGGEVEIELLRAQDCAVISVRDNGVGLKREMLQAIFEPFTQGDQTLARATGGLGMGLTISRRLAELHGGTIEASSEGEGKGATFVLRLPLAAGPLEKAPNESATGHLSRRRRVLIVEDNPDIRESLRMILELWGHDVLIAETGREGVDMAARERPEVALIDIGLPAMNGYEVARAIRAFDMPAPRAIKLVAVTGYGQHADREKAWQSGFDSHLLKPIDLNALEQLLAEQPAPQTSPRMQASAGR
jgi:two-component system, sensor histidine kinase